jgi:hypothetical protein
MIDQKRSRCFEKKRRAWRAAFFPRQKKSRFPFDDGSDSLSASLARCMQSGQRQWTPPSFGTASLAGSAMHQQLPSGVQIIVVPQAGQSVSDIVPP